MKKKITYLIIAAIPFFMVAFAPEKSSAGAPASHTGAPGEQTCATVGCHDDNTVNSGTALLNIEVGNGVTQYIAGQTYPVKVKISDANVTRFGFQLVALDNQTNENVGTFQISDPARTQFMINEHSVPLKNRNYVTYTFNGTDATSSGASEWTVDWTAPANISGPITFYAGGVSANDDMSDKGDYTYTTSKVLSN